MNTIEKEGLIYTGAFVICNFGPDEKTKSAPAYLGDPTRGVKPNKFTCNICKAQTFEYEWAAKAELQRQSKILEAEGHPLAGHLFLAEICTVLLPKEG